MTSEDIARPKSEAHAEGAGGGQNMATGAFWVPTPR